MEDKIKIRNICEGTYNLFTPSGKKMGTVTYEQFNDIRIQCKENDVTGYYIIYNSPEFGEIKVVIGRNGKTNRWPRGMFDLVESQLSKLLDMDSLSEYEEYLQRFGKIKT